MKKIISLITLFFVFNNVFVFAGNTVNITASVGVNPQPIINSINPSDNPIILPIDGLQNFSINVSDSNSDDVNFTITSTDGSVTVDSGTLTGGSGVINFTYKAPSVSNLYNDDLVITLNDGPNLVIHKISVYAY